MTQVNLAALQAGIQLRSTGVSSNVDVELKVCSSCPDGCVTYKLAKPRLIAVGRDGKLMPRVRVDVEEPLLKGKIDFGEDAVFELARAAPGGQSVGDDEDALKPQMRQLPGWFAKDDADGMAARLVEAFLTKKGSLELYSDAALDAAVKRHVNFNDFADRTVAAPGTEGASTRTRIHGALEDAGWDIDQARTIRDLGLVAFNRGVKSLRTEDFGSGLALMTDGIAHAFVFAQAYKYESCKAEYSLKLRFVLLDVFGLDDEDLARHGASGSWGQEAMRGITAWWQLQHQFGYAPLVTKMVVEKSFVVSTKGR